MNPDFPGSLVFMTSTTTDSPRSFSLDPSLWPRQWRAAGALLLDWPLLRALRPQARMALRGNDGQTRVWRLARGQAQPVAGAPSDADLPAWLLPTERVLERRLMLPPLAPDDLAQAVQLDVAAASPFGASQTVHGWALRPVGPQLCQVDVAMASRQQVEQALQAAGFDPARPPEVWVLPPADAAGAVYPVVLRGFGEGRRERQVRQGLKRRLGLLALLLALGAAVAVTPTALVRARAQQAQQSFAALQKQAAPQLAQREALVKRLERLQAVGQIQQQQLAMAPVLDLLTRALPDGAWLTGLRVEGNKLTLNGQADDAAALVQRLAREPGAHEVRLASPATRGAGAAKETFIIELKLDAGRYGPVQVGEGAAS